MKRMCIIGGGPSALSLLYRMRKRQNEGLWIPEITCFEKSDTVGGQWNISDKTGYDSRGEPVAHSSMYQHLWINSPKELDEYPDYSYEQHFGSSDVPSFLPRQLMFDYILGRARSVGPIDDWIRLNTRVFRVTFDDASKTFSVVTTNSKTEETRTEVFDWVVVATGHFSCPNVPEVDGVETFPGKLLHSHDLRDASQFKDKRVLCVGAGFSGIDIAIQSVKFGAKSVTISYDKAPLNFDWPHQIDERPKVTRVDGKTVTFVDGRRLRRPAGEDTDDVTEDFDVIVWCTGFKHAFSFMEDRLKLTTTNVLYPKQLFKGCVMTDNSQLFYMGMQKYVYSFPMFDLQAVLIAKVAANEFTLPTQQDMEADNEQYIQRLRGLTAGTLDMVDFQSDYLNDLVAILEFPYQVDAREMYYKWFKTFQTDPMNYRDYRYKSSISGKEGVPLKARFIETKDETQYLHLVKGK